MKNLLLLSLAFSMQFAFAQTPCSGGSAGAYPCNGYDLQSEITLGQMSAGAGNDSWGWTDPTNGNEYAIMGLNNGTAFVDITNPTSPIYLGKLPTHTSNSSWRDIKTYNNHAYIVSEAGGHGMQIFDLTRLRNVTSPPVTFTEDGHYGGFGSAHNIVINEDTGYAYPVGANSFNGGPIFLNIQNPTSPVAEGGYSMGSYSHDAQIITYCGPDLDYAGREILIGSNTNRVVIVDITDKSNPQSISSISYSNVGYTHQGWFTEDQRYFILGDETDEQGFGFNTRTIVFDFDDLDNPAFHFQHLGATAAIDHNGYVKGTKYYFANYRAGLRVMDISDIASGTMTEEGFFDSYPANNTANFSGAWNVYPYFDSGNIVISDINRGLFIVKSPDYDTTAPVAACMDVTIELDANGLATLSADQINNGSSDNNGDVGLLLCKKSFDCSEIGTNQVELEVHDEYGNRDTCMATVTVEDNLGATFDCPTDATVGYDSGNMFYTVPDHVAAGDVSATDNCTSSLVISQTPAAGTELANGVYTVSFETTDDAGNTTSCSFELTVDGTLSNEDVTLNEGLAIFPNPSEGIIHIASQNTPLTSIAVYDLTGKILLNVSNLAAERHTIDISSFAEGTYFVNINNLITKRIAKN